MSWRSCLRGGLLVLLSAVGPATASAQVLQGIALYEQYCSACHSAQAAGSRAPDRVALSQRTPEAILEAITTGSMAANAEGMTAVQKRTLAEHLALRPIGAAESGAVTAMQNRCTAKPLVDPRRAPMWSGWGADAGNTRFQPRPAAGLDASDVPNLKLKWAFGFPNGSSAFGQPAVAGGRVFVGSDNGYVYAIDSESGCAHWSFQAQAGVRTAISVGALTGAGGPSAAGMPAYAIYFGDLKGNVYAVNAESGALVWTKRADPHPLTRITGAPALDAGRLYVPLSSLEEAAGANPRYECCTFRGGIVVYDAQTGAEIWRSYAITDAPKRLKKNAAGTQLWGPAGAAIWSAPTVDARRGLVYVATGNAYNDPAAENSDAIMAFDLKTGRMRWSRQLTPNDTFIIGCGANAATRDNCPDETGPDFDFGNSVILRTLPGGRSVLTLGQKSGVAWGLDPDKEGAVLWQRRVGKGSALGGMEWGSAADERNGYFPVADAQFGAAEAGGLYALRLTTGEEVWRWKPTGDCKAGDRNCVQAQSAAITVIPGAVFSGATNGIMRGYSSADGKILWEFDTVREFATTNGVAAKGGSINGPGPVVAGGMLFTNSGYSYLGGALPGNVLLAFSAR